VHFRVLSFEQLLDTAYGVRYKAHRLVVYDKRSKLRGGAMNKGELIDKIAKDAKISKVQASNALNSALDGVESTLKKGSKVTLVGFGTFSVSSRKARTGRNPQTGAPLKIPAKKVTKFVAGAELKKAVNRGR
jgi:DNA-binding protein HU-beta